MQWKVDSGEVEPLDVIPGPRTSETPSNTVAGALEEISATITEPLPQRPPRRPQPPNAQAKTQAIAKPRRPFKRKKFSKLPQHLQGF